MSASEKQIRANRANAQKSAGPKTPEGKNTSRRNAFTHGSYARDLIIESPAFSENEEDYDLILTSLIDELQPEGVFQAYLVRKIANCLWRSGRALRAETAHVSRQLTRIDKDRAFNASLAKLIGATDTDENANSPQNQQGARSFGPVAHPGPFRGGFLLSLPHIPNILGHVRFIPSLSCNHNSTPSISSTTPPKS